MNFIGDDVIKQIKQEEAEEQKKQRKQKQLQQQQSEPVPVHVTKPAYVPSAKVKKFTDYKIEVVALSNTAPLSQRISIDSNAVNWRAQHFYGRTIRRVPTQEWVAVQNLHSLGPQAPFAVTKAQNSIGRRRLMPNYVNPDDKQVAPAAAPTSNNKKTTNSKTSYANDEEIIVQKDENVDHMAIANADDNDDTGDNDENTNSGSLFSNEDAKKKIKAVNDTSDDEVVDQSNSSDDDSEDD